MNRSSLCLLALATLAPLAVAQDHYLEVWPGTTNFTTRLGIAGPSTGEVFQSFPLERNRGIGDVSGVCSIDSIRCTVQDQRGDTAESFRFLLRRGTDAAGPGVTAADYFGGGPFGPISTPPTTSTLATVWDLSLTLGTPVAIDCEGFLAVGVELPTAPVWTMDGLSVHVSTAATNLVHPSAPNTAWAIDPAAVAARRDVNGHSMRIAPGFHDAPILQAGTVGGGTRFGSGGYAPDTTLSGAASLGLALRCFHSAGAAVEWVGLANIAGFGSPTPTSFLENSIYLSLAVAPIAFPTLTAADGTPFVLFPAGVDALPSAGGLTIALQGIVINTTSLELTNAIGVSLF